MHTTHSAAHPAVKPKTAETAATGTSVMRVRRRGSLFARAPQPVLPGAESAGPARPVTAGLLSAKRLDVDPVVAQMTKTRQPRRTTTPLAAFHRALCMPAAKLFGVLGFAPGQLSIQSVTFTVLGLATAADGYFPHLL